MSFPLKGRRQSLEIGFAEIMVVVGILMILISLPMPVGKRASHQTIETDHTKQFMFVSQTGSRSVNEMRQGDVIASSEMQRDPLRGSIDF